MTLALTIYQTKIAINILANILEDLYLQVFLFAIRISLAQLDALNCHSNNTEDDNEKEEDPGEKKPMQ